MSKLGTRPFMISVVGNDMAGDFLLKYWRSAGLCTEGILQVHDVATPVVSNVFDGSGELIAGVASVGAVEKFLTPSWLYRFRHHISNAPLVMLDANLPPESLEAACIMAYESGVPVLFEPVSVVKSRRIAPIAEYITCTSPNEIELVAMANSLSSPVKYNYHKMECKDNADAVEYLFEMLSPAMVFLLEKGIKLLVVTLGSNGVFICCKEHTDFVKDQRKCKQTPFSRQLLEKLDGCFPSNNPVNLCRETSSRTCVFHLPAISASVISLTGSGDCLVGGVLSALCGGSDIIQSVAIGVAIAKASVESQANIPDHISAASVSGGNGGPAAHLKKCIHLKRKSNRTRSQDQRMVSSRPGARCTQSTTCSSRNASIARASMSTASMHPAHLLPLEVWPHLLRETTAAAPAGSGHRVRGPRLQVWGLHEVVEE
ncbi:pseudouridine kinase [Panicum miliaceum]|uniref:Pseudouridine kinase n=1 Tax=Panicum miliaceum TaxID=4540 RepID=A0A3L6SV78_PANMI|nr:pseudouridine kinase [Panicum miliaceum]